MNMRVVLRCCLLVTLVLNGLAGARAAAAPAGSAMLPTPATTTAPASAEEAHARAEGHQAPEAASHASATGGHCDDMSPAASPAGDLHGRDCCQDACQCACPSPAHAPSGLAPPLAAGPGPGRAERSDWSSLRPAPLLRPPIA